MPIPIPTYIHPLTNPSALTALLHSVLPSSIPLLRRLQHPIGHSPTAVLLATFPPPPSPSAGPNDAKPLTLPATFAVGYFDRAGAPGIQAWLFTSLELPVTGPKEPAGGEAARVEGDEAGVRCILAVLARFRELSPSSQVTPQSEEAGTQRPCQGQDANSDIIVVGSLHSTPATVLRAHASKILRDDMVGPGGPYTKYLIPSSSPANAPSWPTAALPQGTQYTTVGPADYAMVLANNPFVRSPRNLEGLANAGVRHEATGALVAFVYVGVDRSVRTLHVEPTFRRMGLGKKVVAKLLEQEFEGREGEEDVMREGDDARLMHTDVSAANRASVTLFERLGAVKAWDAYWVRVDLERLTRWMEADGFGAENCSG